MGEEKVEGTGEVGDFIIHPKTGKELSIIRVRINEEAVCPKCNEKHKDTHIRKLDNGQVVYACGSCKKSVLCDEYWKKP